MSEHSATDTPRIDDRVRFRRVFDEAVVIRQEHAEALVVNDTGAAFLELCDGQRSLEEIVRLLAERYEIDRQTLRRDMEAFARELAGEGIIQPA